MFNKTSKDHFNKYRVLAESERICWRNVKFVFGKDKEQVRELFLKDNNLNNIPLSHWDMIGANLSAYNKTVRYMSMSERVCFLKHLVIYDFLDIKPEFID